eukprot:scaffold198099_cov16-Prasinocladus_malaysianus.AAC.1
MAIHIDNLAWLWFPWSIGAVTWHNVFAEAAKTGCVSCNFNSAHQVLNSRMHVYYGFFSYTHRNLVAPCQVRNNERRSTQRLAGPHLFRLLADFHSESDPH